MINEIDEPQQYRRMEPDSTSASSEGDSNDMASEPRPARAVRNRNASGGDSGASHAEKGHPSHKLEMRAGGFGIAAGYEKPHKRDRKREGTEESYGLIPHSGYYGSGEARRPFKIGQAGFGLETDWYRNQYGEQTSGYVKK